MGEMLSVRNVAAFFTRGWRLLDRNPPLPLATVPADGIEWEFDPGPARVIAVGDLHGDLEALGSILSHSGLVDKNGEWMGGDSHVVLNGDLVGGKHSRLLLEYVIRLQGEAKAVGGRVHAMLGNHDLWALLGERAAGAKLFRKYPVGTARTMLEAFTGDSPWARWMRQRNSIIKIGPTLFVHAGLNRWALHHSPERVNASIRAWIAHWQGAADEPPDGTRWTVYRPHVDWSPPSSGPLWTRSFKALRDPGPETLAQVNARAPSVDVLGRVLLQYRAARMVVGHSPTKGNRILMDHPVYGEMVVMIDTRISNRDRGRLSYLEIADGSLKARYPKRDRSGKRIRKQERTRLEEELAGSKAA